MHTSIMTNVRTQKATAPIQTHLSYYFGNITGFNSPRGPNWTRLLLRLGDLLLVLHPAAHQLVQDHHVEQENENPGIHAWHFGVCFIGYR